MSSSLRSGLAAWRTRTLRLRHLDLLHWFSLVSLAAVAAVSMAQATWLAHNIERELLHHDAELARQLVQSIVDTQGVSDFFKEGEASGQRADFMEFFGHVSAMPDVLRANVYATDGRMLWSSDSSLVGQHLGPNEELEEALRGQSVVHRDELQGDEPAPVKPEHIRLAKTQTHFVENYLPIRQHAAMAGAPVIGVVELYRLPSSLNRLLGRSTTAVWLGAVAGGILLYLSMLGLVRRASQLMQQQRARLVEAEASALVGEIAASVAHSIRNPLASIRSGAELQVELGLEAPSEIARETVGHADRIEHLVRTLMSFTHDPSEIHGATDIVPVLHDAVQRFAASFQAQHKTLSFKLDTTKPLPPVHGEGVLLAQVVNSLLANALEATSSGDRVELSVACDGSHVVVEVTDSGPGIEPQRLVNMFKPFHTTKPHGLGMGLALVKRTLQRIGGKVELTSHPGCTRARVQLQRADV